MKRWYLIDWGWLRVDLHEITRAEDPECFHTHVSSWSWRLILFGGYVEEMYDAKWRTWFPGRFGFVSHDYCHRIAGLRNGCLSYTLWVHGPEKHARLYVGEGWK